ncbi:hypothetical protein LE190_14345 [Massilia oculi]|uniref:Type II secretion system protein n=1 Tax=Massilia hydrophila TaxID=3044279 RepID=A0ABS7YCL5_9BURK|nr:hypothetical protein [Massilia oculi]MCA1857098.1 hypothetical protein [Massilia oculi]
MNQESIFLQYRCHTAQSGFSLLQLTMVLLASSILFGSLISVREFSTKFTARKLVAEMYEVRDMVHHYSERYGAIPGDDANASNYLPGAENAFPGYGPYFYRSGDGRIEGNWIGDREPRMFWQHVRLAGLAKGDPTKPDAFNAVGGRIGVTSDANLPTRPPGTRGLHAVCTSRIQGAIAAAMDGHIDDGNASKGQVWAAPEINLRHITKPTPTQPYSPFQTFTVCMAF